MKRMLAAIWKGIVILWEDCLLCLHYVFCVIVVLFLIFGVIAAFTGGPELGIFLIAVNVLLLLLMRKLDQAADAECDRDFQEMVRKNREKQKKADGEKKQ